MHCPRCGTPNEPGDRFCSSCGAGLERAAEPKQQLSLRERAGRLIGTSRKARLTTAATALALLVAVAAFVALEPDEETIPRDGYTIAADRLCLDAKGDIVVAERRAREGGTSAFAAGLVPIVADWRAQFEALKVPADRTEQAQQLEAALLEVEAELGGLARVAAQGNQAETVASAEEADAASARVEEAAAALGLSECASAKIGLSSNSR